MEAIEIFRTNVNDLALADKAINLIREHFDGYQANFDLSDCDRILRIVSTKGEVQAVAVIERLSSVGLFAEILPL